MKLDQAWIRQHIPHQGSMCLLDHVSAFDEQTLQARANNQRDPTNPLRAHGRLAAICGVEYAAQAMAAHAAASGLQDGRPRAGYLASLRSVTLHVARLDEIEDELVVQVARQGGDSSLQLYAFSIEGAGDCLLEGRAAVVFDVDTLPSAADRGRT